MRLAAFAFIFFLGCAMPNGAKADLIVLAAPRADDPYYADVADAIFDFHVAFAKAVKGKDRVVVLVDEAAYPRYARALGEDRVALAPVSDIWMRDFATVNPDKPVMYRYTAAGQGGGATAQDDADAVQEELAAMVEEAGFAFDETDLLNDGGNFVDDDAGNAVVSRKFLRDNDLTEQLARARLKALTGRRHVAFIEADEQGGLEHADGVVSFVDDNVLLVNAYPDDPDYARALRRDLESQLPGVAIHEVVAPHDDTRVHDARFGSACGLYTNALVTRTRVYLPQFGLPEDAIALEQVRTVTTREVVPVASRQVCAMGGGVRCLSWQVRGENAERLLTYLSALPRPPATSR